MIFPMMWGTVDPSKRPASIRLRETMDLNKIDSAHVDSLIDEIQMIEQVAFARSINASTNGRSPRHWSMERWLHILTFAGILLGLTLGLGGEWSGLKDGQLALQQGLADLSDTVEALAATVQRLHMGGS